MTDDELRAKIREEIRATVAFYCRELGDFTANLLIAHLLDIAMRYVKQARAGESAFFTAAQEETP